MKTALFFVVALILSMAGTLSAQSNEYLQGYFVTTPGDTTHGYIQDRTKISMSEGFSFKTDLQHIDGRQYGPEEVISYAYEPNFRFQSMSIEQNGRQKRVFMRQLVTGYASLYEYNSVEDPLYLLTKATGESVQLEKKDSIINGRLKEDKQYIGKMMYLFQDCGQFLKTQQRIEFTQAMLSRFVRQYNTCVRPEEESRLLTTPRKLRFDAGITAAKSTLTSTINNYNAAPQDRDGKGDGYQLGLLVNLSYFEKIALRTGVVYHNFNFEHHHPYSFGDDNYFHYIKSLEIPLNLQYRFSTGRISPYIYGGIKVPFFLEKTLRTQRVELGSVIRDENSDIEISGMFIFNGGVGVAMKVLDSREIHLTLGYDQWNVDYKDVRSFEANNVNFGLAIFF
ncbi:MAG: hypothetical protein R2824_08125 [Saprospiraceae bacterium]